MADSGRTGASVISVAFALLLAGCISAPSPIARAPTATLLAPARAPSATVTAGPGNSGIPTSEPTSTATATSTPPVLTRTGTPSATATAAQTSTATPKPLPSLAIVSMRARPYPGSEITIERTPEPGANYQRFIASYLSDGLRIYALLTVPNGERPASGWPVVVFNHGYIPPRVYRTTERYVAYVDSFARSGYIVFKSDHRGHGDSEGQPSGAYGSPDYTTDVLNAVASLRRYPEADPERIGMWGHSMGGQITLRAMVVDGGIKAGVIWAGVVAPYADLLVVRSPPTERAAHSRLPRVGVAGARSSSLSTGRLKRTPTSGQPSAPIPIWTTSPARCNCTTARPMRKCRYRCPSPWPRRCAKPVRRSSFTRTPAPSTTSTPASAWPCSVRSSSWTSG